MRIRSAAACCVGAPEFPGVSSPVIDLDGTVEIGLRIARSMSTVALSPVDLYKHKLTVLICQTPTSLEPLEL